MHLLQSHDLFGPPERQDELRECWRLNKELFDEQTNFVGRLTLKELFAMCKPDTVNVLANSDIAFDETIALAKSIAPGECYALTRWENGVLYNAGYQSQDVWIISGGPHDVDAPWPMGTPGIDNRLVHTIRGSGIVVNNPSKSIRCHHMHAVQWRSYLAEPTGKLVADDKIFRIPPPYDFVWPSELAVK